MQVLQDRMTTLSEVMKVPLDRVRALVLEKPILLTKSSAAVQDALKSAKISG